MTVTLSDIISCLDEIAPFSMAESWDNVGLLVGNRNRGVGAILIGLDPTNALLEEAIQQGADTVVTHHPAIFKPIPSINTAEPAGKFLEIALTNQINVLACHTNFDSAAHGVNDALAGLLGLQEISPLVPSITHQTENAGMGRRGVYPSGLSREQFILTLLEILELPSVQIAGTLPETINCVALCGGSGSDLAETAQQSGADVYISAEIKHNVARWAEESNFCVIDGTHYATEKPAVRVLADRLREYAQQQNWNVKIYETKTETHPFALVDKHSYTYQLNETGEVS